MTLDERLAELATYPDQLVRDMATVAMARWLAEDTSFRVSLHEVATVLSYRLRRTDQPVVHTVVATDSVNISQ